MKQITVVRALRLKCVVAFLPADTVPVLHVDTTARWFLYIVRGGGGPGSSEGEQRGVDGRDDARLRDDASHARPVGAARTARLRRPARGQHVQLQRQSPEHRHRRVPLPRQTAAAEHRNTRPLQARTGQSVELEFYGTDTDQGRSDGGYIGIYTPPPNSVYLTNYKLSNFSFC